MSNILIKNAIKSIPSPFSEAERIEVGEAFEPLIAPFFPPEGTETDLALLREVLTNEHHPKHIELVVQASKTIDYPYLNQSAIPSELLLLMKKQFVFSLLEARYNQLIEASGLPSEPLPQNFLAPYYFDRERCFKEYIMTEPIAEEDEEPLEEAKLVDLAKLVSSTLKLSEADHLELETKLMGHVGENATYRHKDLLFRGLKKIYRAMEADPTRAAALAVKFREGVIHCVTGLHNRVNAIVDWLYIPENMDALLTQMRHDLVEQASLKYGNSDGVDVHLHNQFFTVASALTLGIKAQNADDPYVSHLNTKTVITHLTSIFNRDYQIPTIVAKLLDAMKGTLHERYDYHGRLDAHAYKIRPFPSDDAVVEENTIYIKLHHGKVEYRVITPEGISVTRQIARGNFDAGFPLELKGDPNRALGKWIPHILDIIAERKDILQGYLSSDLTGFSGYLERILGRPVEASEYITLNDDGYPVDLNWPNIKNMLFQTLITQHYFLIPPAIEACLKQLLAEHQEDMPEQVLDANILFTQRFIQNPNTLRDLLSLIDPNNLDAHRALFEACCKHQNKAQFIALFIEHAKKNEALFNFFKTTYHELWNTYAHSVFLSPDRLAVLMKSENKTVINFFLECLQTLPEGEQQDILTSLTEKSSSLRWEWQDEWTEFDLSPIDIALRSNPNHFLLFWNLLDATQQAKFATTCNTNIHSLYKTSLMVAAASGATASTIRALADAGANINDYSRLSGQTALLLALRHNHLPAVLALLNADADITIRNIPTIGENALDVAMDQCPLAIEPLLKKALLLSPAQQSEFVSMHSLCSSILSYAVSNTTTSIVTSLINTLKERDDRQWLETKDEYGQTPLLQVATTWTDDDDGPKKEAITGLLALGANINEQDSYGNTALHWAISREKLELAQWLMARGANPAISNKRRQNVFEAAIKGKHEAMIPSLLETLVVTPTDPNAPTSINLKNLVSKESSLKLFKKLMKNLPPTVTALDLSDNHLHHLSPTQLKKWHDAIPKQIQFIALDNNNYLPVTDLEQTVTMALSRMEFETHLKSFRKIAHELTKKQDTNAPQATTFCATLETARDEFLRTGNRTAFATGCRAAAQPMQTVYKAHSDIIQHIANFLRALISLIPRVGRNAHTLFSSPAEKLSQLPTIDQDDTPPINGPVQ